MDKAEVIKKISKIVEEHIKSGYTQARFLKLIDEYAQQVSRRQSFLFWKWVHKKKSFDQRLRHPFHELFDEFLTNSNDIPLGK